MKGFIKLVLFVVSTGFLYLFINKFIPFDGFWAVVLNGLLWSFIMWLWKEDPKKDPSPPFNR